MIECTMAKVIQTIFYYEDRFTHFNVWTEHLCLLTTIVNNKDIKEMKN
jgi:hypothetical protein